MNMTFWYVDVFPRTCKFGVAFLQPWRQNGGRGHLAPVRKIGEDGLDVGVGAAVLPAGHVGIVAAAPVLVLAVVRVVLRPDPPVAACLRGPVVGPVLAAGVVLAVAVGPPAAGAAQVAGRAGP